MLVHNFSYQESVSLQAYSLRESKMKYPNLFGKLESAINLLGGEEGLEKALHGNTMVELNPYSQLFEDLMRVERFRAEGAIFLPNTKNGIRDVLLPIDCKGSERSAFFEMRAALLKEGLAMAPSLEQIGQSEQLDNEHVHNHSAIVSLRNTLEYFHQGRTSVAKYGGALGLRDLFCVFAKYHVFVRSLVNNGGFVLSHKNDIDMHHVGYTRMATGSLKSGNLYFRNHYNDAFPLIAFE